MPSLPIKLSFHKVLWYFLLQGRYNKYDVKKYIQFNTSVRSVTFNEETEKFTVVAEQVIAICIFSWKFLV